MADRATLEAAVEELQEAHNEVRADLQRRGFTGAGIYRARDMDGRYLLLESLTAIVTARAVLYGGSP